MLELMRLTITGGSYIPYSKLNIANNNILALHNIIANKMTIMK